MQNENKSIYASKTFFGGFAVERKKTGELVSERESERHKTFYAPQGILDVFSTIYQMAAPRSINAATGINVPDAFKQGRHCRPLSQRSHPLNLLSRRVTLYNVGGEFFSCCRRNADAPKRRLVVGSVALVGVFEDSVHTSNLFKPYFFKACSVL